MLLLQDSVGNEKRLHGENRATGGGNLAKLYSGLHAAASALELSWLVWKEGQPNPLTQNKYVQLTALHCKKCQCAPLILTWIQAYSRRKCYDLTLWTKNFIIEVGMAFFKLKKKLKFKYFNVLCFFSQLLKSLYLYFKIKVKLNRLDQLLQNNLITSNYCSMFSSGAV